MPANLEILAYEQTPLGPLCLRRRELLSQPGTMVTEVTINHEFLMSSLYTDSEQALAQVAIDMHGGSNLNVLVGGLGLGYTAHNALESSGAKLVEPVRHVEVVELLPQVIDWLICGLIPLSPQLIAERDNGRLKLIEGDVYRRLAQPAEQQYDLILIDVDHSPDERLGDDSQPFYTATGLEAARQHLLPDGVLAVWSYAQSSPFADALCEVFDEVRVEPVTYNNQLVDEERTDWLFFAR